MRHQILALIFGFGLVVQGYTAQEKLVEPREITPSTCPCVCSGAKPYATADFLWWKAQVNNATFAFNGNGSTASNTNAPRGSFDRPDFTYRPGFKVGLGTKLSHDGWDLFSQYTWLFVSRNHTLSSATPLGGVDALVPMIAYIPFQQNPAGVTSLSSASGAWGLRFNVLDLLLGREFWLSPRLSMKPCAGLKFSWNAQDFNVAMQYATGVTSVKYDMDLSQFGVAMTGAINTSYYLWKHWSIYGNFALSGMWNRIHSLRQNYYTSGGITTLDVNTKSSTHDVTPILEMGLGMRFDTCFSQDRYKWLLEAGWESQIWSNQAAFELMNDTSPGNLSMQGLTLKTGFWF